MDVQTVPFQPSHLPAAAALVSQRYRRLRQDVPDLPEHYEPARPFLPKLEDLLEESPAGGGFVFFRDGVMAGFLLGKEIPDFMGTPRDLQPGMG